jgi:osmotically inducible protein OsmC
METTTISPAKVYYTAKTRTIGGREHGLSRSDDGHLEVTLSTPGTGGTGTNPEQLFAAGWSACFEGALGIAANKAWLTLPADTSIDAEVDLAANQGGFLLQARLNVHIPGVDVATAKVLVDAASGICPYSKAIKGNVDVEYNVI